VRAREGAKTAFVALATLFLSTATAWSEDTPHYVPDVGVQLTYKRLIDVSGGRPTGGIFTDSVLASDGLVAVLKPSRMALLVDESEITSRCRSSDECDKIIRSLQKETNLLRIPVPKQLAESDAEARYRYFFLTDIVSRQLKIATNDVGKVKTDGKTFVLENADSTLLSLNYECDWSALAAFFPLGKTPKVNFKCDETFVMRVNDQGHINPPYTGTKSFFSDKYFEIAYEGHSSTSLLSKEWEVEHIKIIATESPRMSITNILFSPKIGMHLRSEVINKTRCSQSESCEYKTRVTSTDELVGLSP
jgi:hypothetical protein